MSAPSRPTVPLQLPLPAGSLPVDGCRAALRRYQAGGDADALIRTIDRHSEALESEIHRKLADNVREFAHLVDRLEVVHDRITVRASQATWLREFPRGQTRAPVPVACRLESGHLIAVPLLLAPLHELALDPEMAVNGHGAASWRLRRGAAPAMVALADAGLTAAELAAQLGCAKTTVWRWLNGAAPVPPHLAPALEQLSDQETAARIVSLIPGSRNTNPPTTNNSHQPATTIQKLTAAVTHSR